MLTAHLEGSDTVGMYPLLADDNCCLLAYDSDDTTWRLDALAYVQAAQAAGVPTAVELSRSGEGAHVWTFFTAPAPATDARVIGAALLREAIALRGELDLASYDRLFPSQDYLPDRGFGSLIALPLVATSSISFHAPYHDRADAHQLQRASYCRPLTWCFVGATGIEPVTPRL